jgi:hypothetical protein
LLEFSAKGINDLFIFILVFILLSLFLFIGVVLSLLVKEILLYEIGLAVIFILGYFIFLFNSEFK